MKVDVAKIVIIFQPFPPFLWATYYHIYFIFTILLFFTRQILFFMLRYKSIYADVAELADAHDSKCFVSKMKTID